MKAMKFSFSDTAKIYMNGQALTEAQATYALADYRFLGTVKMMDTVYLPLKKGANELWVALTELDFGGWGFQGEFTDMEGLTVNAEDAWINFDMMSDGTSTTDACTASYKPTKGMLMIPCVTAPTLDGGENTYNVILNQDKGLTFSLDATSIKKIK